MWRIILFSFALICGIGGELKAQKDPVKDSLLTAIKAQGKNDTARAVLLIKLAWQTFNSNIDTTVVVCKEALELSKKHNFLRGLSDSYAWLGYLFQQKGDYNEAIRYMNEGLRFYEKNNDKKEIGTTLNNIAYVYQALKFDDKALETYRKCLRLRRELNDEAGMAYTLNNMGLILLEHQFKDSAECCFIRSQQLFEKTNETRGLGFVLHNRAQILEDKGKADSAMVLYRKSLAIRTSLNDYAGLAAILANIGNVKLHLFRQVDSAIYFCTLALNYARKVSDMKSEFNAARNLAECFEAKRNFTESYKMLKIAFILRDSLFNEEKSREFGKLEAGFEFSKKSIADSIEFSRQKEMQAIIISKQNEKLAHEKRQFWFLVSGLLVVLAGLALVINRFMVTRKQKKIIEEQKSLVESQKQVVEIKQTEIIESIRYAQRIQKALITSEYYISKSLNNLKPK